MSTHQQESGPLDIFAKVAGIFVAAIYTLTLSDIIRPIYEARMQDVFYWDLGNPVMGLLWYVFIFLMIYSGVWYVILLAVRIVKGFFGALLALVLFRRKPR